MYYIKKYIFFLFLILIFFIIFQAWFFTKLIIGGDLHPVYLPGFVSYVYPFSWYWDQNSGLGGYSAPLLWVYTVSSFPVFLLGNIMNLDWRIIERIGFLYPYLLAVFFSPIFLIRKIFGKENILLFSSIVFSLNTYILMVVGGGQLLVALAYGISPLILYFYIDSINKYSLKKSLLIGLLISLEIMIDLRIAYIIGIAVGLYWIFKVLKNRNLKYFFSSVIFVYLIPCLLSLGLHAFWILPTIIVRRNYLEQLGAAYTTTNAVQFLSFAKLENSIALLHPNWFENIFGKVSFMRPEFLLLPILAFASFFFINKLKDKQEKLYILFFAFLGLLGAFLAKGANDPFGGVYLWMFQYFPGFQMFRDPTKWYLLIAISYSMLIPFTLWKMYDFLKIKTESLKQFRIQKYLPKLFILLVLGYMLFLIRPALFGQLTGTLKPTQIPAEYARLEEFLSNQKSYFRTFWMPQTELFGYYSVAHPAVSAKDFFNDPNLSGIENKIADSRSLLENSSIKYVIVPYDSQGEIFLKDRKYDDNLYKTALSSVSKISYLKKVEGFGKIGVFEISSSKDHFWSPSKNLSFTYKYISPVEYSVNVKNAKKGDAVIFAESYDSKWVAENLRFTIQSSKFNDKFNSFILPADGNYSIRVYYTPQDYVNIGVIISVVTLILSLSAFIWLIIKKK